ncbi:MAG: peptide MFS transporter [Planctomycetes bacterium]|nr:peptide MFS transporter [Planctomycetota bacterium]
MSNTASMPAPGFGSHPAGQREILGHPVGLFVLFFAELWERFNFYGMRALLIFYLTKSYLFNKEFSSLSYGAFNGLLYATPLLGGLLADRVLGYRRAIVLGGILMALGEFGLALPGLGFIKQTNLALYAALGLIIIGNGFFKPNISTMVGSLYAPGDARRDSAFTIFYMGINIGATIAPLVCGTIGETYGFHYGFLLAGAGMVLGLICFTAFGHLLGDKGLPPKSAANDFGKKRFTSKDFLTFGGAFVFVPLAALLVSMPDKVSEWAAPGAAIAFFFFISYEASKCTKVERQGIYVAIILSISSLAFWGAFEQAGSSISIFTDQHVDRTMFGSERPASNFQSVNAIFIVLLAPVFSWLWARLGKMNLNPSSVIKFVLGLLQVGAGYIFLVWAAKQADSGGKAAVGLLLATYFVHTMGELCVSPVGLSMITKMAPQRLGAFMMGFWFLTTSFGHVVAGEFASKQEKWGFGTLFYRLMIWGIVAGVLLFLFSPWVKKWERAKLAENSAT